MIPATQTTSRSNLRLVGQIVLGLVLGFALVPAVLELAALAGAVTAFKYQGF